MKIHDVDVFRDRSFIIIIENFQTNEKLLNVQNVLQLPTL